MGSRKPPSDYYTWGPGDFTVVQPAAPQIGKIDEGEVGDVRARHLIHWYEHGEGAAEIAWGTPGDFDRCVAIAGKYMPPGKAKGFCANRHHGALGIWPATHAAMERGHKSELGHLAHDVSGELRDPVGRWTAGGAVPRVERPNGGPGMGLDLVSRDGGKGLNNRVWDDETTYRSADPLLSAIAHEQGFDGAPRVVSSAELDRAVAAGHTELFRGVNSGESETFGGDNLQLSAAQINEQFRTGDAYYGVGDYGNGYYTSTSRETAVDYADGSAGSISRMALDSAAKVIEFETLLSELGPYQQAAAADLNDHHAFVTADPGRYAAARGYDAIRVEGSGPVGEKYYIVLNRTALMVESP